MLTDLVNISFRWIRGFNIAVSLTICREMMQNRTIEQLGCCYALVAQALFKLQTVIVKTALSAGCSIKHITKSQWMKS